MKYTPSRDMLLVRKLDNDEEKHSSGLVLVREKVKNNLTVGVVEKVGRGYVNAHGVSVRSQYKEGDLVVFKLHNQVDEVSEDGVIKYLLSSAEVVATADE